MKTIAISLSCFVTLIATQLLADESTEDLALKAVLAAIQPTLDKLQPEAKVGYRKETRSIEVFFLPQTFKVHGQSMSGEISRDAHDEVGPSYKGFVLKLSLESKGEVHQAALPGTLTTLTGPYWRRDIGLTPLGKTDKQIAWSLAYGSRMDEKTLSAIREKLTKLGEPAQK
jgi:hypothetical protein